MRRGNARLIRWLLPILILASSSVMAAGGGGYVESSGVNPSDMAAKQRGAKLFVNYCLSCHSAEYMRYNRMAQDLGLTEEMVEQNLMFSDAKIGDTMTIAMKPDDATQWLGKKPPDLSVISRSRGNDWLYSFLRGFYRDQTGGWNNLLLANASMPHVLWQMQGIQEPVFHEVDGHQAIERLELVEPGTMSPEEYDSNIRDLVTFLDYLAEPSKQQRKSIGVWVMIFLAFLAFMTFLLKAEYWRDVH